MGMEEMKRIFSSRDGMMLTFIFTLLFIVTNLIMVDFRGIQGLMTAHGQTPFFILILIVILEYLYKNSFVKMNKTRGIFVIVWSLYVVSMLISMAVNGDYIWPEVVVLVMLTAMFCFRLPKELVVILVVSALISLPSLLLQEGTLNESGATLTLVYAAGLIFVPKNNMAMLYYGLPALALLLIITESRTAIGVFVLVTLLQLGYINLYGRESRHRKRCFITLGFGLGLLILVFIRPIYRFFIGGSITPDGVDLGQLTSGRFGPWMHVLENMSFFGGGWDYIDFTELLHVHNIFLDTLGRYGVITVVLFTAILIGLFIMAEMSVQTFNPALFILAFILVGLFEYSYLFMFVYFSPVILFFVVGSWVIDCQRHSRSSLL